MPPVVGRTLPVLEDEPVVRQGENPSKPIDACETIGLVETMAKRQAAAAPMEIEQATISLTEPFNYTLRGDETLATDVVFVLVAPAFGNPFFEPLDLLLNSAVVIGAQMRPVASARREG
jgi:hypothetical protein